MEKVKNSLPIDFEVLNSLNVGMSIVDKNLDIIVANKKVIELLDLPEHLVQYGNNLRDVIAFIAERGDYGAGKMEDLVEERLKLFTQKKPYRFIRDGPNGTYIEVEGNITTEGGVATTYTDVTKMETARIAAEQENLELVEQILEKNSHLLTEKINLEKETTIRNVILSSLSPGISLFDRDLKLVVCNERFLELLDFPQKFGEPGTPISDLFRYNALRGEYGEVDVEKAVADRVKLAETFQPHTFHRQLNDGKTIEITGVPVEIGFVTTYSDVTELVEAHEKSEQTAIKLKEILNSSPIGMGISRVSDGTILEINTTAAKLFGHESPDDILGQSARDRWVSLEQRGDFVASFKKKGSVTSKEIQLSNLDGDIFDCYLSWNEIKHDDEDCILFWMYDITKQKQAQRQLFESEKLASLGGLVAGVAHEINTPIGIGVTATSHLAEEIGACEAALNSGQLSKARLERLFSSANTAHNIILSNLQSAATLVQNFKLVSVDQTSEEARNIQFADYIESILLSLHPKTKKAGVDISLDCQQDCSLYTYPGAISQILTNLITNSIIHGFDGIKGGEISINVSGHADEGIEIHYHDNGKGIPEEFLTKVMNPFFTTKRGQGGSGLGLSIVHNIVTQSLKGNIDIKSVPGEGTMFYITIPVLFTHTGEKK